MIPYVDMTARNAPIREELIRVITEVVDSGNYVGGRFVEEFERSFAAYCGTAHCVGVGSGTEALWLTMAAMGVGPGDEVITSPMTFAATVEAICLTGAKPVFADIDERTYTLDPDAFVKAITPRTKVVIPVHLFGQPAAMDAILRIAGERGIRVIEDAAQAHGAEYFGRKAGSMGDAGCFSFYPSKNLGAMGEAGAVVTHDDDLAMKVRMLRDHGQTGKNRHTLVGWNSRLDAIQAAVLSVKLRYLDRDNRLRRDLAMRYHQKLAGLPDLLLPRVIEGGGHVYHVYALRVSERRALLEALEAAEIGFGIHYPTPVHLQPAYRSLGHESGDFPVAERCASEFVSLPIYPELNYAQTSQVIDAIRSCVGVCVNA